MKTQLFVFVLAILCCLSTTHAQLTFNFDTTNSPEAVPQSVIDGFNEAGQIWSSVLTDQVNVSINIAWDTNANLGGILAGTDPTAGLEAYSDYRSALINDAASMDDLSAVGNLQPGPQIGVWINETLDSPNGVGSPIPYFDNNGSDNNQTIVYTAANARAIGIDTPAGIEDGTISVNSEASWDFDRSDGINATSFDFIGVALHEIGHVLGFFSQVDAIDIAPLVLGVPLPEDGAWATPVDLFRFSDQSLMQGPGIHDMTADMRSKFFSIDGGTTSLGEFSTGVINGNGQQASHWVDASLGLMGPTATLGQEFNLQELDLVAFDVIGWNRVPEPSSAVVCLAGLFGMTMRRKRLG